MVIFRQDSRVSVLDFAFSGEDNSEAYPEV